MTANRRVQQELDGVQRVLSGLRRLAGLEWLLLLGVAPLLMFPSVRPLWTAAGLLALAGFWLLRWGACHEPWPVTPLNGALLLFAVMVAVGICVSPLPDLTLPKAAGLVLGLAAFRSLALGVRDRRSFAVALLAFALLGGAIVAVGAVAAQWLEKVPVLTALTRAIPRLIVSLPDLRRSGVHPNQIAGALALYLPFALALAVTAWVRWRPLPSKTLVLGACVAFLAVAGGTLLLTQSRSGWIGGAAGLLALGSLWGLSSRRRRARVLGGALPLLVLLGALGVVLFVGDQRVSEALYGVTQQSVETVAGSVTLRGRVELWNRALYAIQDFAFTGCGLGTFRRVVHILYPLFLFSPDFDIAHVHNIFLQTALDLGLPGLIAYLALLALAGVSCWRWARRGGPWVRGAALGLAAGLVGLHVYGLADALTLGSKPGLAFWVALGLVASLERVGPLERAKAEEDAARVARGQGLLAWALGRPWLAGVVLAALLASLTAVALWGWQAAQPGIRPPAEVTIRLPVYPAAQDVELRAEAPLEDAGWVGDLEVATFKTVDPLTGVQAFYTAALADGGWETAIEAADATSWGGIYTRNEGRSVCLLNAFDVEGQVWVSIVCGDKAEPVDLPLPPQ